jgi:uncharacterized membrane protein
MAFLKAKELFSEEQKQAIQKEIYNAELKSSGEIRVHIENKCKTDVLTRAAVVFSDLKMHETAERNGVLIYVAVKDRFFAIIGDQGINQKVPANFWDNTKQAMLEQFKNKAFFEGIVLGIRMAGEQLVAYFPRSNDDTNELSNEISFGD